MVVRIWRRSRSWRRSPGRADESFRVIAFLFFLCDGRCVHYFMDSTLASIEFHAHALGKFIPYYPVCRYCFNMDGHNFNVERPRMKTRFRLRRRSFIERNLSSIYCVLTFTFAATGGFVALDAMFAAAMRRPNKTTMMAAAVVCALTTGRGLAVNDVRRGRNAEWPVSMLYVTATTPPAQMSRVLQKPHTPVRSGGGVENCQFGVHREKVPPRRPPPADAAAPRMKWNSGEVTRRGLTEGTLRRESVWITLFTRRSPSRGNRTVFMKDVSGMGK